MTELARALEDLGAAEITVALEAMPLHAFLVDGEGVVRWQNEASRAGVGDWVGRRWYDQIPEILAARPSAKLDELWAKVFSAGEPPELTLEVRNLDGRVSPHDISAAPLRDGGTVVGFFGIAVHEQPRAHRASPPASDPLTKRQLEVLELLARGKSTDQIAAELYLSKTTVRNHIAHMLANLGVHTRLQAIIVARTARLIEVD